MSKWADYVITAVHYDNTGTFIESVYVSVDTGEKLGPSKVWTVNQVAQAILQGHSFVTAVEGADGKWYEGAPVDLSLRTRQDKSEADNLENLPKF